MIDAATKSTNTDAARSAVLYVDDEAISRFYFKKLCANEIATYTADSVDEALLILSEQSQNIGVIFCDLCMPNKSGTELFRLAAKRYPNIKLILTTAFNMEIKDNKIQEELGEDIDLFQVVEKPWDIDDLVMTLHRALAS